MARLIFHVGMHKTGSSAIQESLAAASGNGYIYPQLGAPPFKTQHTDALITLFSSKLDIIVENYRLAAKSFRPSDQDEARIRQAARDAGSGPVILSSEGAYAFLRKDDLIGMHKFIQDVFEDVTIAGYVREPLTYLSSVFQQSIKTSRTATFTPGYKQYRNFRKFDKIIGRDKVILWAFDPDSFPNRDVVEHFTTHFGLTAPSMRVNASLSHPAVAAIYRLNKHVGSEAKRSLVKMHKVARIAIERDFPHGEWPTFRLAPCVWMEERLGCSLRPPHEPKATDVRDEADLLKIDKRAREQLATIADTLPAVAGDMLREALAA